jgi:hypothetical protein
LLNDQWGMGHPSCALFIVDCSGDSRDYRVLYRTQGTLWCRVPVIGPRGVGPSGLKRSYSHPGALVFAAPTASAPSGTAVECAGGAWGSGRVRLRRLWHGAADHRLDRAAGALDIGAFEAAKRLEGTPDCMLHVARFTLHGASWPSTLLRVEGAPPCLRHATPAPERPAMLPWASRLAALASCRACRDSVPHGAVCAVASLQECHQQSQQLLRALEAQSQPV